jgi:hypothetical protein
MPEISTVVSEHQMEEWISTLELHIPYLGKFIQVHSHSVD